MNDTERDELLIRLDERGKNFSNILESFQKELEKMSECLPGIGKNKTRITTVMWAIGIFAIVFVTGAGILVRVIVSASP